MVELRKGNWQQLQGSVLVYNRYSDPDNFFRSSFTCPDGKESQHFQQGEMFTLFCDSDPARFTHHIGAPAEVLEDIVREAKQDMPKELLEEGEPGSIVLPIFGTPLPITHETDLLIRDWNALDMGADGDCRNCARMLSLGSLLYFTHFE
jgi:hypothetical protein